jgi:3',5'-cyclic AMP phosphodiesterase CpdA
MPLQLLPADPPSSPDEAARPLGAGPSRRGFLSGLAAGGASLALGLSSRAAAEEAPGAWYALVADVHIAADLSTRVRGEVMADNLRAVVADILASGTPPRGVLVDGDLALKDGQAGDYRALVSLLEPLRKARLPMHLTLGNHDDRAHFRDVLRDAVPADTRVVDKQVAVVEGPGLRLVVLDSLDQVDVTPGRLGREQLDWLAGQLDAKPEVPALVFVHHNPESKKGSGLLDTEALLEVLRGRRQAKAVVFGHTHVWDVRQEDGLYRINLPAVAYPFAPTQPLGWCRFRPEAGGGELELRCVGGNRAADRRRVRLRWRDA